MAPDSLEGIYEVCQQRKGFVWVDLRWSDPDTLQGEKEKREAERSNAEEFESVIRHFEPYRRELEGANKNRQRPNVEHYEDLTFAVLEMARYVDVTEEIELHELRVFAGPYFVVTVSLGELEAPREARLRLESEPEVLRQGPIEVLYSIMEQLVGDYMLVVDGLEDDINQIEQQVFKVESGVSLRTYKLFREVTRFERAIKPLAGALDSLIEDADPETRRRIRGIHNHVLRVTEEVSDYRELLTNMLSVNQNEQTKKISAWAAIVLIPALIAGIYGMNFDNMPELHWRFGYLFALSLMVFIAVALYLRFKRSGWL